MVAMLGEQQVGRAVQRCLPAAQECAAEKPFMHTIFWMERCKIRVRGNKREPQKQKVTAGGNIGVVAGAAQ